MDIVKDFLLDKAPMCTPLTSIENINKLMDEHETEEVFVVDSMEERHLLGVIYKQDIEALAEIDGVVEENLNAERCMRSVSASSEDQISLEECQKILDDNRLEHLPVIDEEGHLAGSYDRVVPVKNLEEKIMQKKEDKEAKEAMVNEGSPVPPPKKSV